MKISRRHIQSAVLVFVVVLVVVVIARESMRENRKAQEERMVQVAASVFPLYDIVRTIGGDAVKVTLVLPAGNPPESLAAAYRGTDMTRMQTIFIFGHGFDDMVPDQYRDRVHAVDAGIELLLHEGLTASPFYWLSPANGRQIAQNVRDRLIALDPSSADLFRANTEEFIADLQSVDESIRAIYAKHDRKMMVVYGYDWAYYANDYDLTILEYVPYQQGIEPAQEDINALVQTARENSLRAVFSDIYVPPGPMLPLLLDGSLSLINLDILGGDEYLQSYFALIAYNTKSIVEGLAR